MFKFESTVLPEVVLVIPDTYKDDRGFFRETFKSTVFAGHGIETTFPQSNVSLSGRGVMRGLHFQREPHGVAKLISCVSGALFDVAVDVREDSTTFGQYFSEILTSANGRALYVPEGFAHGFLAMEDNTVASYLMSGEFNAQADAGIAYDDPDIGIAWPFTPTIVSEKDRAQPKLRELFT